MTAGLPLMKNALAPLTSSIWLPSSIIAAATTKAAIQNKFFGSETTALIISNEEMKITQSLLKSGLLIKGVSETI